MARQRLAYTTDLTDEEWPLLKPLLPPEKSGGRHRKYAIREVINRVARAETVRLPGPTELDLRGPDQA